MRVWILSGHDRKFRQFLDIRIRFNPLLVFDRTLVHYCTAALASMFSGYIQAGAYSGLDGVMGRQGWQVFVALYRVCTRNLTTAVVVYRMRRHLPPDRLPWILLHPRLPRNHTRLLHYRRGGRTPVCTSRRGRPEATWTQSVEPQEAPSRRQTVAVLGSTVGILLRADELPFRTAGLCAMAQVQRPLSL
jgi:hypothetical protein